MTFLWRETFPVSRLDYFGPGASAGPAPQRTGFAMANAFDFIQQVRAEAAKVTWPTRRETMITTGLVILMVFAASIFFVVVDQSLHLLIGLILGIGR